MQAIFYLFFSLLLIWDATIFLLLVASPFFSNRLRRRNHLPDILLLIPAHNEEMVIGHTLSSLKDCPARVVVIADHCTDRTLDIVKEQASRHLFSTRVPTRPSPRHSRLRFSTTKTSTGDI